MAGERSPPLEPRLRGDDVQKPAIGGRRGNLGFAHAVQIEIATLTLAMTTWAVREPRAIPRGQRRVKSLWKGAVGENLSPRKVSPDRARPQGFKPAVYSL
jgi:hypothetical protein